MGRFVALLYGLICYVTFVATFLYSVAFVGNYPIEGLVPKTIDSGEPGPLVSSIIINLLLLGVFGIQHTVMARPGFKAAWILPKMARSCSIGSSFTVNREKAPSHRQIAASNSPSAL